MFVVTDDEEFECASVLSSHTQDVKNIAWHPHQDILASCSYDDAVKLFREEGDDWTCFSSMESHESTVWCVSFDSTGSRLASCSDDKTVKIWQEYLPGNEEGVQTKGDNPCWKCVCTLAGFHDRTVYCVDWSRLSGEVVTAAADDCLRVFREEAGGGRNEPSFSLVCTQRRAHSQDVNCAVWNPQNASLLASCSDDATVKLWQYSES